MAKFEQKFAYLSPAKIKSTKVLILYSIIFPNLAKNFTVIRKILISTMDAAEGSPINNVRYLNQKGIDPECLGMDWRGCVF